MTCSPEHPRDGRVAAHRDGDVPATGWAACRADVERSTPRRPRRRPPGLEWSRRVRQRHLRAAGCGRGAGARVLRASRAASSSRASRTARGSRTPDGACFAANRLAMSAEAAARPEAIDDVRCRDAEVSEDIERHGARPRHRTACLAESQPGQRSAPARPDAVGGAQRSCASGGTTADDHEVPHVRHPSSVQVTPSTGDRAGG